MTVKAKQIGKLVIYPFQGGYETISVPGTTTLGRVVTGSNFMIDINGVKKRIPGNSRQDSGDIQLAPNGNARGLWDFWRTSGTAKVQRTVFVGDGKVWADNAGDGIYLDVTGPVSLNATDPVSIDTFYGLTVMGFKNSLPIKYDQGSACALLGGTPPDGKYVRTGFNRLWIAGIDGAPDRLRASVIDNPEDWAILNGAQTIDLDFGDQDPVGITALMPLFYGRLVVGKRRSIYEVTPSGSSFAVRQVFQDLGVMAHNAVGQFDNDLYFPSERGIHSYQMTMKLGQTESAYLSYPIQNFYVNSMAFDRATDWTAVTVPETSSYLLACGTNDSPTNNLVLGYNISRSEWYSWEVNVASMCKWVDQNNANKTKILLTDDKGKIAILDTTQQSRGLLWYGEKKKTTFTTGRIYPVGVNLEATFRNIKVYFRPSVRGAKVMGKYFINGNFVANLEFPLEGNSGALIGDPNTIIGSAIIGGDGLVDYVTRELKGNGSSIQFQFTHDMVSEDDDFQMYGMVLEYEYAGETQRQEVQ